MEDLRISVRISYDEKDKKYSLVNRKNGCQNENITAKETTITSLPIQDAILDFKNLSTQGTNNFKDIISSTQSQSFKVKCEPQDNISRSNFEIFSRNEDNQSKLKTTDAPFRDPINPNSISPILTQSNSERPSPIRIKQEFKSSFHNDLGTNNIDSSHTDLMSSHSLEGTEETSSGSKRVKCKSECVEENNISMGSTVKDRCNTRSIKAEPCVILPEHNSTNMKQEPTDQDYDINVDAASPMILLHSDNTSIAEEDPVQESTSVNVDLMKDKFTNNTSDDTYSQSSFSNITNLIPRTDKNMDCSQSDLSQDDASYFERPVVNVIACNEDPRSGCSYITSSLSSYQVK